MYNEIEQRPRHDHSCLLRQYETSSIMGNSYDLVMRL